MDQKGIGKRAIVLIVVAAIIAIPIIVLYIYLQTPGGSPSTAILLSGTESGYYGGGGIGDGVWYKISASSGQRAIVTLTSSTKLQAYIHDSSILAGASYWESVISHISLDLSTTGSSCVTGPAGYYYVEVSRMQETRGDYTISVSYVQEPTGVSVGGSFSDAITMTEITTTGYVGQNQSVYYKLLVTEGGFVAKLNPSSSPGSDTDQFLILYTPDQRQMWCLTSGWTLSPGVDENGYYYAEVWGLKAGNYTLQFFE